MSREHFNGSSTNKTAVVLRLSALAILIVMGVFLIFYKQPLQTEGPWGAKSFGIAIAFIAAAEMIAYEQRLRSTMPPSPSSSTKTDNSNLGVVLGMLVIACGAGFLLARKF
tara:strand:+ start:394 stop:726 length:333 start_codon:yes stop_codon:yes gene_type:complete